MTMGEKILNMRKARGWSQEELAERIGVTRQAVSRWESGAAKPDADKLIAVCDLFGVSADYLLRDIPGGTGAAITCHCDPENRFQAVAVLGNDDVWRCDPVCFADIGLYKPNLYRSGCGVKS